MKKKFFVLMLAVTMGLSLASCGNANSSTTEAEAEETETEEEAAGVEEEETAETQEEEEAVEAEEDVTSEADDEEKAESATQTGGGMYVDFDDMSFYVNGNKYTLGVSTLQDMIDDGVPFNESDIENAGNNLGSNYQSAGFKIELAEYWSAQVYTLNDTDSGKTTSECYINEVYLPVHTDETQDILSFAFPVDVTMEELVANAGEPDESSHYDGDNGYYSDTYEYTKESELYYSESKYKFEFTKGELTYITITYMP